VKKGNGENMKKKAVTKVIRVKRPVSRLSITVRSSPKTTYDKDFYKWSLEQSMILKKGEYSKLDIDNLREEIEALGRSEKRALESFLKILLLHLLKCKYQPEYKTPSWDNSIKIQRYNITKSLEDNPSLRPLVNELIKRAYYSARLEASNETSLNEKIFPVNCPWTLEECMAGESTSGGRRKVRAPKRKSSRK